MIEPWDRDWGPDFDWSNTLGLGVGYLAYDTAPFDLAVRFDLNAQLVDNGAIGVVHASRSSI